MLSEVELRNKIARREINPKWLKWAEAAELIGVSVRTMRLWRYGGVGPVPWKLGKKTLRYTEEEVLAYLERLAAGDPDVLENKPRWDPKTFQFYHDTNTVAATHA